MEQFVLHTASVTRSLVWFTVVVVALTACVLPDGDGATLGSTESNVDERSIQYRMREAPLEFAVGEAHADEVAYGQCESVEPEEGADYQIDCGMPWVEVAWYYVSSVSAEEAHQAGFTQLRMTFSTERLLRASIHRILPSGDTQKLASNTLLTDGDSIAAPLDEPGGYFIYVARGRSMWPVWDTGSIAFEVTPSFE